MHSHGPGGGLPPPPTKAHSDTHAYHKPGGRLPLLSAKPTVTFPAVRYHCPQASTKLYCLVTEAHRCEKLAHSFYAMVPGRDSNPRPLDLESGTLPRHHDATFTWTMQTIYALRVLRAAVCVKLLCRLYIALSYFLASSVLNQLVGILLQPNITERQIRFYSL